jgi:glutamate N-acetyltransferase/amino-acid N-acetyltransferase
MTHVLAEVGKNINVVVGKMSNISVPGFLVSTASAGIKSAATEDMVLIFSQRPAAVAAAFTKNKIQAAPVKLTKNRIKLGVAQAVIINSGSANACTGIKGKRDAQEMASLIARELGISYKLSLVCSTGVIGELLPMERVRVAVKDLITSLGPIGWEKAATAIMTTDTFPKLVYKKAKINGVPISLLGLAKGAGMIMPNMATMLAFFLTDAAISPSILKPLFKEVIDESFNCISVDGETSPNDTALILANGYAQNEVLPSVYHPFKEILFEMATTLAKMIAKDGEGASKLISIRILGAKSIQNAKKIAARVANSPLVKTAIYGEDPNWGRIMPAIGQSGVKINPQKIDIFFGKTLLVKNGVAQNKSAKEEAKKYLKNKEISLTIDLHLGNKHIIYYTCDLTPAYIEINAKYHT